MTREEFTPPFPSFHLTAMVLFLESSSGPPCSLNSLQLVCLHYDKMPNPNRVSQMETQLLLCGEKQLSCHWQWHCIPDSYPLAPFLEDYCWLKILLPSPLPSLNFASSLPKHTTENLSFLRQGPIDSHFIDFRPLPQFIKLIIYSISIWQKNCHHPVTGVAGTSEQWCLSPSLLSSVLWVALLSDIGSQGKAAEQSLTYDESFSVEETNNKVGASNEWAVKRFTSFA